LSSSIKRRRVRKTKERRIKITEKRKRNKRGIGKETANIKETLIRAGVN
jgi:hypothetical protein